MSQNNLLQGYSWETQYEDAQVQFSRPMQDEVISVYEVYVKEETVGPDGRSEVSVISGVPGGNDHQPIQDDCMDLDAVIESDVINMDGTVAKLLGTDSIKYKILEQSVATPEDGVMVYTHPVAETPSTTSTRLIDKDDPRSRLHFVKYLKRDGKTLKIWECGICSKEFRHQYTLMRHLPTHTDERNFKCEACGKAFRQLSTLSQHKAIHSDARPYVCEFCKKTFNRVSTLISHRKTHSEHKPHKCHLCGKGFHQKGNLRNHVFTHTNERPYKCELCGKGFNQMSNLVCHKVKAHAHAEKMQYACGICGKEFPRRFSLRSHEEYKHGIKYRHPAGFQGATEPNVMRNKNVRIVHLPNGERTSLIDDRDKENLGSGDYMESVVIDKIETKAMESAVVQGQTPFALYKPAKGIPVLVKVSPTGSHKHILTPATAEDLRIAGKMTLSPTLSGDPDGVKAVQIKVPVVATVVQRIDIDGKISFTIEPPGPDQEQDNLGEPLEAQFSYPPQFRSELERQNDASRVSASEDCNELLELAAQGGIQFVRATEDGRYEVMTNSEARDLMAQNSHDVTILDGEDADAINAMNIRGTVPDEVVIGDPGNQIMVLDSGPSQKPICIDDIEILEDKDIRILETKSLDDRFVDGMTFLSQSKIDDLILGPKSLNMDGSMNVGEHDDMAMSMGSNQQDLSDILDHRSDVPGLSGPSQHHVMTSLLSKNQHATMSLLNDTLPYLKNGQGLSEDMGILSDEVSCIEDHHSLSEYSAKMKLAGFDDCDTDTSLLSVSQSEVKILGMKNQNVKILGNAEKTQHKGGTFVPTMSEVKILGSKGSASNDASSQYQEIKILGSYEQFVKSATGGVHVTQDSGAQAELCGRKEVKILGKKLETAVLATKEDGSVVKVSEEKIKTEADIPCTVVPEAAPTPSTSQEQNHQPSSNVNADFLIQACGACGLDFLNFGNHHCHQQPARSSESHFDVPRKERGYAMTELPDLD